MRSRDILDISDRERLRNGGSMDYESEVADLTDMDEYETKIDLAKAYIDMGDAEAAKVIAEEVVEKGNEDQKKEAQAVLDKLSA